MQGVGLTTMLRVDLGRVAREGSVLVEARIPADDELWAGSEIGWGGPVDVRLKASYAGSGEVVVRGSVSGRRQMVCRRCLEPVEESFDEELTLVFVEGGEGSEASLDAGAYALGARDGDVDLGVAVREEVILAMNPYVVCDPGCKGLCPKCGANLNEVACDCTEDEVDPRWSALRGLTDD